MQIQKRILDAHGRVCIPVKIRKEMNLEPYEELDIVSETPDKIIIKKIHHKCLICGKPTQRLYKGKYICYECVADNLDGTLPTIS